MILVRRTIMKKGPLAVLVDNVQSSYKVFTFTDALILQILIADDINITGI